jgi:predicted DNA-binding transcriptional regulator YafY
MSEAVRLYQYKAILSSRRAMPAAEIMARLEISRATFNRDITKLRDQLHMPIRFDRDQGGYVLDAQPQDAELPGLWFSPQEVLALVTLQHLLAQLEPGLLGPKLKPIQDRLNGLMEQNGLHSQDVAARVRVLHAGI